MVVVYPAPQARQRILVSEAVFETVEQEETTYTQEVDEETGVVTHTPRTEMVRRTVEVSPAVLDREAGRDEVRAARLVQGREDPVVRRRGVLTVVHPAARYTA